MRGCVCRGGVTELESILESGAELLRAKNTDRLQEPTAVLQLGRNGRQREPERVSTSVLQLCGQ